MRLNGPCTRKKTSHKKIDQTIYPIAQHLYCGPSSKRSKDRRSNQRYDQDRESTIRSFLACDVIVWKHPVTVHACPICRNPVMLEDKSVFLTSFACANHSAVAANVVSTTPYSDWSILPASDFPHSLIYRISQGKQ